MESVAGTTLRSLAEASLEVVTEVSETAEEVAGTELTVKT